MGGAPCDNDYSHTEEAKRGAALTKKTEECVKNARLEVLSDAHYKLRRATYEYKRRDGQWQTCMRESYDLGDGAAVLPIDPVVGTVVLIKQFRWPAFELGYKELLIEAVAGKLDGDDPETCIRREAVEEAGIRLLSVQKIFTVFSSPGAVTERLHLFLGEYDSTANREKGGGLESEGEDIEVIDISLQDAYRMIASGQIIDAKTIVLLQAAMLRSSWT
jgi:nudix-type nucleoside diphosphatase (YffH/AdpP family)